MGLGGHGDAQWVSLPRSEHPETQVADRPLAKRRRGSCQVGVSYDYMATQVVIASWIGDCPLKKCAACSRRARRPTVLTSDLALAGRTRSKCPTSRAALNVRTAASLDEPSHADDGC